MKIRIKGNSIRIRLTQTEVNNFGKEGYLEEATEFLENKLVYAIQSTNEVSELTANLLNNKITLMVPHAIANNWVNSELVGFQNNFKFGNNQELFLLIEKDFVCLDNTFEDQSDMFPNPNAVC
jgi:hypothetical protein